MTISSSTNKVQFNGGGTTGPFAFTFKTFATTDLVVISTDADDVETTLELTTDYSVTLNEDQNNDPGGEVTTVASVASGYKLTIVRVVDALQETDITNGSGFYPEVIENALDRLTMLVQQVDEKTGRALVVPVTSDLVPDDYLGLCLQYSGAAAASAASAAASAASAFNADGSTSMTGDLDFATDKNISVGGADIIAVTSSGAAAASGKTLEATSGPSGSAFGFRNKIINGGFTISQRGYVSGAVLASGSYGHDRFKAGASGGDYSFTQLASNTTITIASGKSLIQVIEDKNVSDTSYVLSWTGTAQARYAVNSATPAGSYAASPILITGQTAGTVMSVEFNTGTLGKVQLETGSVATPFESRPYGTELALCQRYYQQVNNPTGVASGVWYSAILSLNAYNFPVVMRVAPTICGYSGTWVSTLGGGAITLPSLSFTSPSPTSVRIDGNAASGGVAGQGTVLSVSGSGTLTFSAEL